MKFLLAVLLCIGATTPLGSAMPLEPRAVDQCRKVNLGITRQPAQEQALYAPFCSSYLPPSSTTSTVIATSTGNFVTTVSSIDSQIVTTTVSSLTTKTVVPTPVTVTEVSVATITSSSISTSTVVVIYKRASRTKVLPVATPTGLSGASPQQISLTCSCLGLTPRTVTALTTSTVREGFTSTSSLQSTTTASVTVSTAITVITTAPTLTNTQTVSTTTTTTVQATETDTVGTHAHLQASSSSGSVSNQYLYFAFTGCATTPNCFKFQSTRPSTESALFYVPSLPTYQVLIAQGIGGMMFSNAPGGSVLSISSARNLNCAIPSQSDNFLVNCGDYTFIKTNDATGYSSSASFGVCGGELWALASEVPATCPSGPMETVTLNFVPV